MNWKPIETAPKAGPFLVWIPTTRLPWPAYAADGVIRSNAHGHLNEPDKWSGRILRATHWMPLPAPPNSGDEQNG